jgi:hypothetical protein
VSELLAGYREGDRVLLANRFVEMDLAAAGTASPSTRAFVTWPLEAHLPAGVNLPYTPLPFRVNAETRPALESSLREAFAARRVWLLGAGPSFRAVAVSAGEDPRITFARTERHGGVRLMRFDR